MNYGEQRYLMVNDAQIGVYDVSPEAQHFWRSIEAERLQIQHCEDCDLAVHPRQASCPTCFGASLKWKEAAGLGTVYTFSDIHRPPDPTLPAPYTLGIVRLDEGVYLFAALEGRIEIGTRVEASVERDQKGYAKLMFRPVTPENV